MLKNEVFSSHKKIFYIPLGYDFKKYDQLKKGIALKIRKENYCKSLLPIRIRKTKHIC